MTTELERLLVVIDSSTEELRRGLRKSEQMMAGTQRQIDVAAKKIDRSFLSINKSSALAVAGVASFAQGVRELITLTADFQSSMSAVSAVSGATGKELEKLERQARDLGSTTVFSAKQAAEGMEFLARAGFDTNQILASLPATLDLAAAGNVELGRSADLATNIMSAFSLQAQETTRAVDVMALTSSRSNTNMEQLGDAMKLVGPVANAFGISIETTSASIGVLSDSGLQATLAGTGLRQVITQLANVTPQSEKVLKSYGLTIQDVNPATHSLVEILERLAAAGLTGADAMEIFGQRGGPAFLVLQNGTEKLRSLTAELEQADGTARRMAETMQDNLAGSFKAMVSALQETSIALGSGAGGRGLRDGVDAATEVIRELNENFDILADTATGLAILFGGKYAAALVIATQSKVQLVAASYQQAQAELAVAAANLRQAQTAAASVVTEKSLVETSVLRHASQLRLTAAQEAYNAALAKSSLAARGAAASMGALNGVMAFFGGPIGLAISAAAGAMYYFATSTDKAEEAANRHKDALEKLKDVTDRLNGKTKTAADLTREEAQQRIDAAKATLEQTEALVKLLEAKIQNELFDSYLLAKTGQTPNRDATTQLIVARREEVEALKNELKEAEAALSRFNAKNPPGQPPTTPPGGGRGDPDQAEYRKELERTVDQLELLAEANQESQEAYESLNIEIEAHNEALEKGYKLGTQEYELIKQTIIRREELKKGIAETTREREKAIKKAEEEQRRISEALLQPWQNAFENVQDELGQMLSEGRFSFESLADIAKRLAGEVAAAWVIRPILEGVISSGSGTDLLTGGAAAAGGFGLGDLTNLTSLGKVFSGLNEPLLPGSISGIVDQAAFDLFGIGQSVADANAVLGLPNIADNAASIFSGNGGISSNFTGGSALAGIAGSLAADLLGLSGEYSGFTSTAGGLIGTAVGGPIGAALGSFLGSAVGGLFGGSSRPHPAATFGAGGFTDEGALTGIDFQSKHIDDQFARALSQSINSIAGSLVSEGIDLSAITSVQGGVDDGRGFLSLGDYKQFGSDTVTFDPEDQDALEAGVAEFAILMVKQVEAITGELDDTMTAALNKIETEGRSAKEIIDDLSFVLAFDSLGETPEQISEVEAALDALHEQFAKAAEMAERLGLSTEKVAEAQRKAEAALTSGFDQSVSEAILALTNAPALAMAQEIARFNRQLEDAKKIGADTKQVELLHALNMAKIQSEIGAVEQSKLDTLQSQLEVSDNLVGRFSQLSDAYADLLDEFRIGQFTGLHPVARLEAMRSERDLLAMQAQLGDPEAAEKLAELIPAFLELSGDVNGFNAVYAQDLEESQRLAEATKNVIDRQLSVQEQMVENTRAQISALQDGFQAVVDAINSGNAEAVLAAVSGGTNAAGRSLNEVVNNVGGTNGSLTVGQIESIGRQLTGYTGPSGNGQIITQIQSMGLSTAFDAALKNAAGYAEGGLVTGGPDGIDQVPSFLSNKEFVMRRSAVSKIGQSRMEYMNRTGNVPPEGALVDAVDSVRRAVVGLGHTLVDHGKMNAEGQEEIADAIEELADSGLFRFA